MTNDDILTLLCNDTIEEEVVHYIRQKKHLQRTLDKDEVKALNMMLSICRNPKWPMAQ
jgi:SNF2 family DNA or RNA helicase